MIRITAVGDIMPGGLLHGTDKEYLSNEVKELLHESDVRIGTLECAIGDSFPFFDEKMRRKADVIHAKDDDIVRLLEMNINVVSLANNHFFDLGYDGAWHTMELLNRNGIKYCGAGRTIDEASKPAVVEIKGKTIAFLGFCDYREETVGWCPIATEDSAGINPLLEGYVEEQISKYSRLYDYIVVIPHWGLEHTIWPTGNVYRMMKKMITAGADLIYGGHPHHIQPLIKYCGASVALSMGNFLFPDRLINVPRSTYYPDTKVDLSILPTTYDYPYVTTLTIKRWREPARIGMVVVSEIDNGIINSYFKLIKIDLNNYLCIEQISQKHKVLFVIITFLFKAGLYSSFDKFHVFVNKIRKHLRSR